MACGLSCEQCPQGSSGAEAICERGVCGFRCSSGKLCGDRCGECCESSDCVNKQGWTASCDKSSLTCQYACAGDCCKDADCPQRSGNIARCDLSSYQCNYSCGAGQRPCSGKCIAASACCDDSDCVANFACTKNVCSTSSCQSGYKFCTRTRSCIASSDCCEDSDCGGFTCGSDGRCTSGCQTGSITCHNGECMPKQGACVAVIWTGNNGACYPNICTPEDQVCENNKFLSRTLEDAKDATTLRSKCEARKPELLSSVCRKYGAAVGGQSMRPTVQFYADLSGDDGSPAASESLPSEPCP